MTTRSFKSLAWTLAGIVCASAGYDLWRNLPYHDLALLFTSLRMQAFAIYVLLMGAVWLWGWLVIFSGRKMAPELLHSAIARVDRFNPRVRQAAAVVLVLGAAYSVYVMLGLINTGGLGLALFVLSTAAVVAGAVWPHEGASKRGIGIYFSSIVCTFAAALVLSRLLSANDYPFSLGWSEGNRLWDYSLLFGSGRYDFPPGERIFGYISPGRMLVWGLPFLFPSVGIYSARLWAQLVNVLPYAIFAYMLLDGAGMHRKERWLFAAWGFLFLSQGPVYPHLVVAAIIMLLGVRARNLFVAAAVVAASAYFAYYSRWSWVYAPGLWAGMLALMRAETPTLHRRDWPKLLRPFVLGLAGFIGGQLLPLLIWIPSSTHPDAPGAAGAVNVTETEAFSQALLWDRLWPNPTYLPGILLGLLLAVGPLILWLVIAKQHPGSRLNALQKWGAAFPVLAFLVVGVIASTKIGGGGDLHNMDMLLVAMLILAAFYWPNIMGWLRAQETLDWRQFLIFGALLFPSIYTLRFSYSPPVELPPAERTQAYLEELRRVVEQAKEQGEVLFMDQRQLLTFGYIKDVPLVDAYEKKVLIDKAMSANQEYFDDFYRDIASQRFVLIVTEPIKVRLSDGQGPFAEENDVWVEWISAYLSQYYKILMTYKPVGVQLLVPR